MDAPRSVIRHSCRRLEWGAGHAGGSGGYSAYNRPTPDKKASCNYLIILLYFPGCIPALLSAFSDEQFRQNENYELIDQPLSSAWIWTSRIRRRVSSVVYKMLNIFNIDIISRTRGLFCDLPPRKYRATCPSFVLTAHSELFIFNPIRLSGFSDLYRSNSNPLLFMFQ